MSLFRVRSALRNLTVVLNVEVQDLNAQGVLTHMYLQAVETKSLVCLAAST